MTFSGPLSRRSFLRVASLGIAAPTLNCAPLACIANALAISPEFGNPLHEFRYGQVEFQPGLHQEQLEQTHAILMGMDEESLLRPFRMAAGLPAPGRDLGGWYSATQGRAITGPTGPETFGQWISALSRYHAMTGDQETRLKVERLVEAYAKTIEPRGNVFQLSGNPTYFYDKLICGLGDAFEFAGVKSALPLISMVTDAALSHLTGKAIDELGPEGEKCSESYTIPENQFIAWQRGAGDRHLDMAKRYMADDFYFGPLSGGKNVLSRRHAYSHVLALSSAAKAYLVLGDEKYLKAAQNGLAFVEQQSFATGAWGPSEHFLPRPATDYRDPETGETKSNPGIESLGDSLLREHSHFETPCGAYAHFKLTRYLLRITKNPSYGDSMERVMYNTVLGALPLNKFGKAFYQSNYHSHARKAYFDGYGNIMEDEWPCCSGTLPQIAADYRISTYFRDREGVFVNLYIPSTLSWKQGDAEVALTQSGQYPLADEIAFQIRTSQATSFAVRLRIPAWAHAPSIRVNGKLISESIRSGTFATIRRRWRSGDRVDLVLPHRLELKPVDSQHPDIVALVRGPLVLFAVSDDTPKVTRTQLLAAKQARENNAEWQVETANGPLRMRPFWAIKDEMYFTYLSV